VPISPEHIRIGLDHLQAADDVMHRLIGAVGPFQLRLERDRFKALVRSIIAQQISGSAARSIYGKLEKLLSSSRFTPEALAVCTPEQLRTVGLSSQKAGYLLDLAGKVSSGQVRLRGLHRLSDAAIIEQLIQVKGIGVWTAQMFLIFALGRLDVFPPDDLGIRVALRNLYALPELPDRKTSHAIAERWRPYATLASWYCWRSLELPPPPPSDPKTKNPSPPQKRGKNETKGAAVKTRRAS
jgi:DNA-3-methyladenine glycosylase II